MNLRINWEFLNEVYWIFSQCLLGTCFRFFLLSVGQVRPGESAHSSWSAHGRLKRHWLSCDRLYHRLLVHSVSVPCFPCHFQGAYCGLIGSVVMAVLCDKATSSRRFLRFLSKFIAETWQMWGFPSDARMAMCSPRGSFIVWRVGVKNQQKFWWNTMNT